MAEFHELQSSIQQIRKSLIAGRRAITVDQERLKKLETQKKAVLRTHSPNSQAYSQLLEREQQVKSNLEKNRKRLEGSLSSELSVLKQFEVYSDPRQNLGFFDAETPIMLAPLRIETRFKIVQTPIVVASHLQTQHQLWVRVFPDTFSVDSFDDVLSMSERERMIRYWVSLFQAGTAGSPGLGDYVKEKERAAWKKLMGIFNAGRAYWLTRNFGPKEQEARPIRQAEDEVFLVITLLDKIEDDLRDAIEKYWILVAEAKGNAQQLTAAFNMMVDFVGGDIEKAKEIVTKYEPRDAKDLLKKAEEASNVEVVFITFPNPVADDTKVAAWTQASKVTTLPENLVLIAYDQNGEAIVEQLGNRIPDPLIVGPDTSDDITELLAAIYGPAFDTMSEDEKAEKYMEYLAGQSETKWLFDFEEAVSKGMGFKVNLSEEQYNAGFSKLMVLGVKLSADAQEGKEAIETLFAHHQFGDTGFSLIPQGTATNNTEDSTTTYDESEDADEAFDRYFNGDQQDDPFEKITRVDGRWLANSLGISVNAASLKTAANYYGRDQLEARAMNTALWNGTIGYYLESMITPVVSDDDRAFARDFFIKHVSGRGRIPAIRISNQPYGILPATTFNSINYYASRRGKLFQTAYRPYLEGLAKLNDLINRMKGIWFESGFYDDVAYVGKEGDAHQILLKALGLHATSVEFDRRIAKSEAQLLQELCYNQQRVDNFKNEYAAKALQQLQALGYQVNDKVTPDIPLLKKFFLDNQQDLHTPLIDDTPLSEINKIRAYTPEDLNYIEWLITHSLSNHQIIKDQSGFNEGDRPNALLYELLRYSINLEFGNTALKMMHERELINRDEMRSARVDVDFIGIQDNPGPQLQTKWDLLYRTEPQIDPNTLLVDQISQNLTLANIPVNTRELRDIIDALELLKDTPTARLERSMVEMLDTASYRLDAWIMGHLDVMMEYMRFGGPQNQSDPRDGLYIGAYGIVEKLLPEDKELSPAAIDSDIKPIFDPNNEQDIVTDNKNGGYIHAPSLSHGLTASVLRNAYISTADEADAELYKVNLSSERVRLAMGIIEGMQKGQSLGAMLGYQLERILHDNTDEEMDVYIYELRKVFPIGSNRIKKTAIKKGLNKTGTLAQIRQAEEDEAMQEDQAVTQVEARNVVDGLALLEHLKGLEEEQHAYPFDFETGNGKDKLLEATGNKLTALNDAVDHLKNVRDAVADLAIAESVHQVVQGNYERASGALDAYSKGAYPHLPDVIQSQGSGVSLTNRFGIHLDANAAAGTNSNPRTKVEPALAKWVAGFVPPSDQIACSVSYSVPSYDGSPSTPNSVSVNMLEMELEAIDLLYIQNVESAKNLNELDEYVISAFHKKVSVPLNVDIQIDYRVGASYNFFEINALLTSLRALLLGSRALRASDLSLQNEGDKNQDNDAYIDTSLLENNTQTMEDALSALKVDVIDPLSGLVDLEVFENSMTNSSSILNVADAVLSAFSTQIRQALHYGVQQGGAIFVQQRKAAIHDIIFNKVVAWRDDWEQRDNDYKALIASLAGASEEEKINILQEAEALVAVSITVDFIDAADLETKVNAKYLTFDTRFAQVNNFLLNEYTDLKSLIEDAQVLVTGLEPFMLEVIDVEDALKALVVLVEDVYQQTLQFYQAEDQLLTDLDAAIQSVKIDPDPANALKVMKESTQKLFGESFIIVPKFRLSETQTQEMGNVFGNADKLLDFQRDKKENPFPMDDWLYGQARVREKLGDWENSVMLGEGFDASGVIEFNLKALQFPFIENDTWLGLEYPEEYEVESDKLLYTAHMEQFTPGDELCGLLIDEWTEVIPAKKETTGLSFHYDRPNCEPPQTVLLALSQNLGGQWEWQDLVQTIHDTLDMAKLRAVEPDQIDQTNLSTLLPATISSTTKHNSTISMQLLADPIFKYEINKG